MAFRVIAAAVAILGTVVLTPVLAQDKCADPAPDPTGCWEWVLTEYFQDPDPVYPGDGMTVASQIDCRPDGVMVSYFEEIQSSERPFEIACLEYDTGLELFDYWSFDGRMIDITGEPGARIMTWTLPYYDGSRIHWVEREPIETVETEIRSLGSIKGLFR